MHPYFSNAKCVFEKKFEKRTVARIERGILFLLFYYQRMTNCVKLIAFEKRYTTPVR